VGNGVAVFGELADEGAGAGKAIGVVVEVVVEYEAAGDEVGFEG
jgi:hypothetical protein